MTLQTHTRILPLVIILVISYLLWRTGGGLSIGPDNSGCHDRFGEENMVSTCLAEYDDCLAADGVWNQEVGPLPSCSLPTTDGGTPCTDGTDCQGDCLADSPTAVVGACNTLRGDPGCRTVMQHGTPEVLCRD